MRLDSEAVAAALIRLQVLHHRYMACEDLPLHVGFAGCLRHF